MKSSKIQSSLKLTVIIGIGETQKGGKQYCEEYFFHNI